MKPLGFKSFAIFTKKLSEFFALERNVQTVCVTGLIGNMISNAWYTFLPLYFQQKGATIVEIGNLFAILTLIQFGARLPGGFLGDYIGKKNTIILSQVLRSMFSLLVAWSDNISSLFLFVCCVLFTLGVASDPTSVLVAESVSEKQRTTALGVRLAFLSTGFMLGPLIGGAVKFDFHFLFTLYSVVGIISAILSWILISETTYPLLKRRVATQPNSENQRKASRTETLHSVLKVIFNILFLLIFFVLISFRNGMISPFRPSMAQNVLALDENGLSLMFSGFFAGTALGSIFFGKMSDKFGTMKIAFMIPILFGLLEIAWISTQGVAWAIFTFSIIGALFGGYQAAILRLITDVSPAAIRTSMLSVIGFIAGLASSLGSSIGGTLFAILTPLEFVSLGALIAIFGSIVFLPNFRLNISQKTYGPTNKRP